MDLPFDLAVPLLVLHPKNLETNSKEPMHPNVIYNSQCWKQPKCPSVNEWIKKPWYIFTMEYYTAETKKGAPTLFPSMLPQK